MDVSDLLEGLNPAQREAVGAPLGNLLVLAGAGSGKTRVLVHRIAWLIKAHDISPYGILAVTFTNKAAAEMRGRIESMLNMSVRSMWVGTFHGLAHRLLRAHWAEAGLPETFQILDSEDQHRLIKRIHKNLNLDDAAWPPKQTQWFINAQKDKGLRARDVPPDGSFFTENMVRVYTDYEQQCQRSGLVDFAELLLRSYELLKNNEIVLQHYRQRFQQVLVDEFQDTNAIQYSWLRLITGNKNHLIAVGDDDQSIYSWRGAQVENLNRLMKDYADIKTIRLEQNYRSTQTILNAANAVIARNMNRMGKKLWTDGDGGERISLYEAFNDIDETRYVIDHIREWVERGNPRSDAAVLYRSNAQSRVFEEQLTAMGIPYRVYGGFRFFERAEIKDALAYLRLMANRDDDAAFERIVNVPTRGIGHATIESLRLCARERQLSLWQAARAVIEEKQLSARAGNALLSFLHLIEQLDMATKKLDLPEQTFEMLKVSGLLEHYRKDKSEKGQSRVENLEELVSATRAFPVENEEGLSPLAAFLSHAALEAGDNQADESQDCVQLMTLHSAKGLEFPIVFIVGVEEGLFPHQMSLEEPGRLEEERRLCYVGMTRAMKKLFITHAERRRLYGREMYKKPSRFIEEIPADCLQGVRLKTKVSRPVSVARTLKQQKVPFACGFQLGQRVRHEKFGEGTVLNYEGSGDHARIQVKFSHSGSKWLVLSYANLEAA